MHAPNIIKARSAHSAQLERWFTPQYLEAVSKNMLDWYGGDIALAQGPGKIYARKGGDFVGVVEHRHGCLDDDLERQWRARQRQLTMNALGSWADIQSAWRLLRRRMFAYNMAGGTSNGLWIDSWTQIAAGVPHGSAATPAAAPGGTVTDKTTSGTWNWPNPDSGLKQFFMSGEFHWGLTHRVGVQLLTDQLHMIRKAMNSTTAQAVTGVPTRYQSTTPTDDDYIRSNFVYPRVATALPNTAHNHVTCTYLDEAGGAQTFQTIAGRNSAGQHTVDLPQNYGWFMPLPAGSVGVGSITQIQTDAAVATGQIDFVLARPLAWIFEPQSGFVFSVTQALRSAFQMTRIFDGACFNFLTNTAASGTGSVICNGTFDTVIG